MSVKAEVEAPGYIAKSSDLHICMGEDVILRMFPGNEAINIMLCTRMQLIQVESGVETLLHIRGIIPIHTTNK